MALFKLEHVDPEITPPRPEELERLLMKGMPVEAVREDGTLDPEVLREHGWHLVDGMLFHHYEVDE